MITNIKQFKESFNFNIERPKPKNDQELLRLIDETIRLYGYECDLNFIDTSLITLAPDLFSLNTSKKFNGDISKWDVSNIIDMSYMFEDSKFEGNIDDWNINPNCYMKDIFNRSELEKQNKLPIWYKKI